MTAPLLVSSPPICTTASVGGPRRTASRWRPWRAVSIERFLNEQERDRSASLARTTGRRSSSQCRCGQAGRGEHEPPRQPERGRIDEQGRAAPSAPRADGLQPLASVELRRLTFHALRGATRSNPSATSASCCVTVGERHEAAPLGVVRDRREVHAAGDVDGAWVGERVLDDAVVAVPVDVTARRSDAAVVDRQRVAAVER